MRETESQRDLSNWTKINMVRGRGGIQTQLLLLLTPLPFVLCHTMIPHSKSKLKPSLVYKLNCFVTWILGLILPLFDLVQIYSVWKACEKWTCRLSEAESVLIDWYKGSWCCCRVWIFKKINAFCFSITFISKLIPFFPFLVIPHSKDLKGK